MNYIDKLRSTTAAFLATTKDTNEPYYTPDWNEETCNLLIDLVEAIHWYATDEDNPRAGRPNIPDRVWEPYEALRQHLDSERSDNSEKKE